MAQKPDDKLLEIRSGLRRMDFSSRGSEQAAVEFVRDEVLPAGQRVSVPLGLRDGQLRVLIGQPLHLKTEPAAKGKTQHHYRLSGLISIVTR